MSGTEQEVRGTAAATWWLTALAFFLGVALCALVVVVGDLRPGERAFTDAPQARAEAPRAGSEVQSEGDVLVRLPSSCFAAVDRAEATVRELDDLVEASRRFDARRLREIVDRFQQLRPEFEDQADACRDEAAASVRQGTAVIEVPSATASP